MATPFSLVAASKVNNGTRLIEHMILRQVGQLALNVRQLLDRVARQIKAVVTVTSVAADRDNLQLERITAAFHVVAGVLQLMGSKQAWRSIYRSTAISPFMC
jgi:hypothetical protein